VTTGTHLDPRAVKPSDTDGDIFQTIDGVAAWGPGSDALNSVIVTVTNGVPMLMFDADSSPVTTEVPS
jgi:hypothetical protein